MTKHMWAADREAEFRRMYEASESIEAIAHAFEVTSNTVWRKIANLGLKRDRANAWSDESIALMIRRHAAGDSAAVIAQLIGGVTRNAVTGQLHRRGIVRKLMPKRPSAPKQAVRGYVNPKPKPVAASMPAAPHPVAHEDMGSSAHAKPFMLTTKRHCKWPIGSVADMAHSMMMVCAATTVEGRPYCGPHCERAGDGYTRKTPKPPYEASVVRVAT